MFSYYTVAMAAPVIIVTVTLGVYTIVMGNTLTASTAFPALSLLNTLRMPLQQFPRMLTNIMVEGRVSLERMNVNFIHIFTQNLAKTFAGFDHGRRS